MISNFKKIREAATFAFGVYTFLSDVAGTITFTDTAIVDAVVQPQLDSTITFTDNFSWLEEYHKTVMSQYVGRSRLNGIINSTLAAWGIDADFDEFYAKAWDLDTATGYWLECWGTIVGFGREIITQGNKDANQFGYYKTGYAPFNQAPFASGANNTTVYIFNDDQYRRLIRLKARANFGNGSPAFINKQLNDLFNPTDYLPYRKAFVTKTGTMAAYFIFDNFVPEPWELEVVLNTQIIPKPAGVLFGHADATRADTFGFFNTGYAPFNQAPFND